MINRQRIVADPLNYFVRHVREDQVRVLVCRSRDLGLGLGLGLVRAGETPVPVREDLAHEA